MLAAAASWGVTESSVVPARANVASPVGVAVTETASGAVAAGWSARWARRAVSMSARSAGVRPPV